MKKVSLLLALLVTTFVWTPVFALDLGTSEAKKAAGVAGYDENTSEVTLAEKIGKVVNGMLSLVGMLFTFLIAYAGGEWMVARGNEEQITKSKKMIIGSIMGLITTLAAYTASNFAVNITLQSAQGTAHEISDSP